MGRWMLITALSLVWSSCKSTDSVNEYKSKSMATEATVVVKGLARAVQRAYEEERAGPPGTLIAERRLPQPSAGPTPPIGSCCKGPGAQCAPNLDLWQSEPWKTLLFSMDDPHRFSYEYRVTAKDKFTVYAYGDLDCDGDHSTYSLSGKVDNGAVTLDSEITRDKPLE